MQLAEKVKKQDVTSRVFEQGREEITGFTHFVQKVTYGGELVVSIRISNSKPVERSRAKNTFFCVKWDMIFCIL